MQDGFKIYIDNLRDGHTDEIDEGFSVDFLDVNDKELSFQGLVQVTGEAYIADQELILHLEVEAEAQLPCAICNALVQVAVHLTDFYYAEPLKNIKGAIFDFAEILREALILEVPQFAECQGNCPHRAELNPYFKKEEGYNPFQGLQFPLEDENN